MQGFARFSDGADGRRVVCVSNHDQLETRRVAPRDDLKDWDCWDSRASGKLRRNLAALRAVQLDHIVAPGDAAAKHRGRGDVVFAAAKTGVTNRIEWRTVLIARLPAQFVVDLAISFGSVAALVMFWNTFGPPFVTALMNQPVP